MERPICEEGMLWCSVGDQKCDGVPFVVETREANDEKGADLVSRMTFPGAVVGKLVD